MTYLYLNLHCLLTLISPPPSITSSCCLLWVVLPSLYGPLGRSQVRIEAQFSTVQFNLIPLLPSRADINYSILLCPGEEQLVWDVGLRDLLHRDLLHALAPASSSSSDSQDIQIGTSASKNFKIIGDQDWHYCVIFMCTVSHHGQCLCQSSPIPSMVSLKKRNCCIDLMMLCYLTNAIRSLVVPSSSFERYWLLFVILFQLN